MKKLIIGIAAFFFLCGMSPTGQDLLERLKKATDEIITLKTENTILKGQIKYYQDESKDTKIALEPIRFLTEAGYNDPKNPWAKNPDHMRRCWDYIKKYESLLTPEARASAESSKINVKLFVLAWMAKETHYNPFLELQNENKSWDHGICQINSGSRYNEKTKTWTATSEAWDDLFSHLPPELQKKKCYSRTDTETGIAMLYVWINHRVEMKWSWAYLTSRCKQADGSFKEDPWPWTLYYRTRLIYEAEG
jgi:hypothetical protein